jgi:hypothetical protein
MAPKANNQILNVNFYPQCFHVTARPLFPFPFSLSYYNDKLRTMKNKLFLLLAGLALAATGSAQSINVTTTGVGIGTTAPAQKLDVVGNVAASGNVTVGGSLTVAGTISGGSVSGLGNLAKAAFYESPEQPIPGSGNKIFLTHGLGGIPKFTTVSLRCKVAQYGYLPDDEVLLSSTLIISNNHGVTTAMNPTQIKMVQYGEIYVHNIDSVTLTSVTPGKWVLVFRAWR